MSLSFDFVPLTYPGCLSPLSQVARKLLEKSHARPQRLRASVESPQAELVHPAQPRCQRQTTHVRRPPSARTRLVFARRPTLWQPWPLVWPAHPCHTRQTPRTLPTPPRACRSRRACGGGSLRSRPRPARRGGAGRAGVLARRASGGVAVAGPGAARGIRLADRAAVLLDLAKRGPEQIGRSI